MAGSERVAERGLLQMRRLGWALPWSPPLETPGKGVQAEGSAGAFLRCGKGTESKARPLLLLLLLSHFSRV